VRQTVDYLHQKTNLMCVVNTTGTPYYERQPLRDVVIWYGLSQGIRDGILKEVAGNIRAFDFEGDVASDYLGYSWWRISFREYGEVDAARRHACEAGDLLPADGRRAGAAAGRSRRALNGQRPLAGANSGAPHAARERGGL
jgi:hypothetical protein